ncbi:MAG: hypothetical protein HS117_19500 [Verrucomicrobiaceae bacterium]|nr:hypothetical protein [Verrucomicrobiaceae bacterium]
MAHESPSPVPIPAPWRKSVAAILRKGVSAEILVTQRARNEFEARFPDAWAFERNTAMADAITQDSVLGRRITGMREPGEVWAFWFHFRSIKLYAKINLTPSGKLIIIYSAHVPLKGEENL